MRLDVRFDAKTAVAKLTAYHGKVRDRALVKGLNRAATTVRAVGARLIAAELKPIKTTEVKKAISIKFATRTNLVAVVRAGGRPRIPLTALGARGTKTGVTVRVGGKVYTIAHAFFTRVQKGRRYGVKIRAPDFRAQLVGAEKFRKSRKGAQVAFAKLAKTRARHARSDPDYPIAEIFAPGVPMVFVQDKIMRAMRGVALERFNTVIAQEVKFLQSKNS